MIGSPTWIDEVLSDSFPASDPPPWIPGVVRPAPANPDPEVGLMSTVDVGDIDTPHGEHSH